MRLHMLAEGFFGDIFRNFLSDIKANVHDKHGARRTHSKLIAAAEALTVPLFSTEPDALGWWDLLFNTFRVPEQYRKQMLRKLVTAIKPHIPTVEDDIEAMAMRAARAQAGQELPNQGGKRRSRREFSESQYNNPHTPFDFKNYDSITNRFLDLMLGNKRTLQVYLLRSRNKQIAILACNMLLDLEKSRSTNAPVPVRSSRVSTEPQRPQRTVPGTPTRALGHLNQAGRNQAGRNR